MYSSSHRAGNLSQRGADHEGEIASVEMTKSCARYLTDRIKAGVNDIAELLHRAHEDLRGFVARLLNVRGDEVHGTRDLLRSSNAGVFTAVGASA